MNLTFKQLTIIHEGLQALAHQMKDFKSQKSRLEETEEILEIVQQELVNKQDG